MAHRFRGFAHGCLAPLLVGCGKLRWRMLRQCCSAPGGEEMGRDKGIEKEIEAGQGQATSPSETLFLHTGPTLQFSPLPGVHSVRVD